MKKIISLIVLSFSSFIFSNANAVEMRPVLTLEMAKKMAQACEDRASQEGWRMNIAIMDAGGNLIYFQRMDRAFLKSIEIAILKAETSAGFPFSTKVVEEIAATRVPPPLLAAASSPLPRRPQGRAPRPTSTRRPSTRATLPGSCPAIERHRTPRAST